MLNLAERFFVDITQHVIRGGGIGLVLRRKEPVPGNQAGVIANLFFGQQTSS